MTFGTPRICYLGTAPTPTQPSSHFASSLRLGIDNPVRRIAVNAANAGPAFIRCRSAVPPRVHAVQATLAQSRPRDVRVLVPEAVVGLEEGALQTHVHAEAGAAGVGIWVAGSSAGLLPVAGSLEVLLGADVHAGGALEATAGGAALGDVLAGAFVHPGDVGGGGGGDVRDYALADVVRDHAWRGELGRGGCHAEDAGVAFFAKGGRGRLLDRAGCHGEGEGVGQSQQEHSDEQHNEREVCLYCLRTIWAID